MQVGFNKNLLLDKKNTPYVNQNDLQKSTMQSNPSFKGPLDGVITQSIAFVETNQMANAALLDVVSMVIPRSYVDAKKRNKYAGAETLIREISSTIITCLSAGIIALGISNIYNKLSNPKTKVNTNSWASNDSLNLLKEAHNTSKNTKEYVSNVLSNISGADGHGTTNWNKEWVNENFYDDKKWNKFEWKNPKFNSIQNRLKTKEQIIDTFSELLDNNVDKKDAKQIIQIIEHRITNAVGISHSAKVQIGDKTLKSSISNILRDTYDLGKNVFTNENVNIESAIKKLTKMNKVKSLGAILVASGMGLTTQYINRQITKRRTGSDDFVGEIGLKPANSNKKENKAKLWGLKALACAGMIAMTAASMKVKSPKEFVKKLEFTSLITSGNAIKTIYASTILGRFISSKNETELRETSTRDFLGFINWLILGGFVSKGVANLLDRGQNNLFNIEEKGSGIKHWLNKIHLKSHAEIAAKGTDVKNNIRKLNIAHISGFAYSTIALGILLPLLNIHITKSKHKKTMKEQRSEQVLKA